MTVKEFYEAIGGGYDEAIRRFRSDDMVKMFLNMFLEDTSYQILIDAMDKGDVEEAFRGAHSLKGTASNVALTVLLQPVVNITEALRGKDMDAAKTLLPVVVACYEDVTKQIKQIEQ